MTFSKRTWINLRSIQVWTASQTSLIRLTFCFRFRQLQESKGNNAAKEFYIQVVPDSGMNVVCPNYVTVNSWLKEGGLSVSNPTLYENMWLVDKQGYDKCAVNEKGDPNFNKLFLLCNKPQGIEYKSLIFDENFNDVEPKFSPGQHYYFICEYQIRNVLVHLGILIGKVFRLLCYLYTYLSIISNITAALTHYNKLYQTLDDQDHCETWCWNLCSIGKRPELDSILPATISVFFSTLHRIATLTQLVCQWTNNVHKRCIISGSRRFVFAKKLQETTHSQTVGATLQWFPCKGLRYYRFSHVVRNIPLFYWEQFNCSFSHWELRNIPLFYWEHSTGTFSHWELRNIPLFYEFNSKPRAS